MSNQPAAIQATFSDFRIVKSRKIAQLVCEVPLEQADAALATLGGLPQPASERWLALAPLNVGLLATPIKPQEKRRFEELKSTMQAGIRCGEPTFWRFLTEECLDYVPYDKAGRITPVESESKAAAVVRNFCKIDSRSALNLDPKAAAKWQELDARYMLWLREPQHA